MTGSQYLHGPELFLGVVLGGGGCDGHESAQLVVASHQEGQGVVAAQRGAHQHGILHPQGPQHTLQQLRPPGLCAGLLRRCGVPKTWEQEAPLREAGKELRTAAHHGGAKRWGAAARGTSTPNVPEAVFLYCDRPARKTSFVHHIGKSKKDR